MCPFDLVFGITRPPIWRDDPPSRADKIALRLAPMYPPHDETFGTGVAYLARRLTSIYRLLVAASLFAIRVKPF